MELHFIEFRRVLPSVEQAVALQLAVLSLPHCVDVTTYKVSPYLEFIHEDNTDVLKHGRGLYFVLLHTIVYENI